jgi:hypothetical protein
VKEAVDVVVAAGAEVCIELLLLDSVLELDAGTAVEPVGSVVDGTKFGRVDVDVAGADVLIAAGGGVGSDKVTVGDVDAKNCEVVVTWPVFVLAEDVAVESVVSSSESSSPLKSSIPVSTPELMSSPSASNKVDPTPLGRG